MNVRNQIVNPTADSLAERVRQFFGPLWAGRADHLPPASRGATDPITRALNSSDLSLLAVRATERHRVATEIAHSGQRCLSVAADPAELAGLDAAPAELSTALRERDLILGLIARWPNEHGSPEPTPKWWSLAYWTSSRGTVPRFKLPEEVRDKFPEVPADRIEGRRHLDALLIAAEAKVRQVAEPPRVGTASLERLADARSDWDRVVVLDANAWTPQQLEQAARHGKSWTLLGDPHGAGSFAELWHLLHRETWVREGERLCCRLAIVPQAERPGLACEPVADEPDIELRIHQPEGGQPFLAEIVFPAGTTLSAAKEYLGKNLDEWPIELPTEALTWEESADKIVACSGCLGKHSAIALEPTPGVSELIAERTAENGALPWFTCGFSFARAAGWDRPRAEDWLRSAIQRYDAGRTARVG